jgi:hypothetical protein
MLGTPNLEGLLPAADAHQNGLVTISTKISVTTASS